MRIRARVQNFWRKVAELLRGPGDPEIANDLFEDACHIGNTRI
jgi:hypothetical protein